MSALSMETSEPQQFLVRSGLAAQGESSQWTPLTGGVSSEIWRVDLPGRALCVKRALAQLKVAAEWKVSTSRNAYEWEWIRFAAKRVPGGAPVPLAHDPVAGLFAMEFLDPATHPVWKSQLMAGDIQPATAAEVGALLARLHAASAYHSELQERFDTSDNFHALRLEPYLLTTAARHPQVAATIEAMVRDTAAERIALVHGDVSPKNILIGPNGPVLLDAECAWFGDPAFDLAFCLNHLLLKCLARPASRGACIASFRRFVSTYFGAAMWEPRAGERGLEHRAARLLPVLLLARVDGKSPVEYIVDDDQRALVRMAALPLIAEPVRTLAEVAQHWSDLLERHYGH
ncbi:MAG: aminoglycoside phosphotransferase family protein [Pseudomonadota bacterium]